MKQFKLSLVLLMILSGLSVLAQSNFISYKAIIKDNLGNAVANQMIDIRFTILQGVAQTNVYEELLQVGTDQNGLVVLEIGAVDPGDFEEIKWANDDHYLKVEVDIGGGFVDMGTTVFNASPYANYAHKSSGLEPVEGGFFFGLEASWY